MLSPRMASMIVVLSIDRTEVEPVGFKQELSFFKIRNCGQWNISWTTYVSPTDIWVAFSPDFQVITYEFLRSVYTQGHIVSMVTNTLMGKIGSTPILTVKVSVQKDQTCCSEKLSPVCTPLVNFIICMYTCF